MSTKSQVAEMAAGGIQDGYLGTNYQFKLLDLFAHRSVESKIEFELYTELANTGKFDDVTLKIVDSKENFKFIFGQAKHKKNPEFIKFATLITNKDFQISNYFDSLLEIDKHYENVASVQLITNNKVDDSQYKRQENGLIKLIFNKHQALYVILDTSNDFVYKNLGKRFKFPGKEFPKEHQTILENLRCDFVAKELVDLLLGFSTERKYSTQNRKFLFENIFDATKLEFREEVLDGTNPNLEVFRSSFESTFKEAINKKNRSESSLRKKNCWGYWKQYPIGNKLRLILESSSDSTRDQENFEKQLERFIEIFVLVTSLETEHIEDDIQAELQRRHKLEDVRAHYQVLTTSVKDWYTGSNKNNPVTKEVYEEFFNKSQIHYKKMVMMDLKETMFSDLFLEFKTSNTTFLNFLNLNIQKESRILHIITPESEESFTTMEIYSLLSSIPKDTYIMLKTSLPYKTIEQGVSVFKSEESCKLMILEVNAGNVLTSKHEDILLKTIEDESKHLIVINGSSLDSKLLRNSQDIKVPKYLLADLTDNSLKEILNLKVKFQNHFTTWKDLLDERNISSTPLADLLKTGTIAENVQVSKECDHDLYVSRTFVVKNYLKQEILKETKDEDEFVYSQQDFEVKSKNDSEKNIHWLEKSEEDLKWIKSSRDISTVLKFIDEGKVEKTRENSILGMKSRIVVLIDIAGMGKSTVLNFLAQQLKEEHPNKWVVKIDLNDYTSKLEGVDINNLKSPAQAIEFLMDDILKLTSDWEKSIFKTSCELVGNVILLFDGFDEVASYYKEPISQLIKALLETSIQKIFIASRPEWSEYLETEFLQIKQTLMAFSKEDQENYLLNFYKENIAIDDETDLKNIITAILDRMPESLSRNDYKFTGVPLIIKLVAQFFEHSICQYFRDLLEDLETFITKIRNKNFNLFILFKQFVEKNLIIYFEKKLEWNLSISINRRKFEKEKKRILDNYKRLALEQILKTRIRKYLPAIDLDHIGEDDLEDLVNVGLINMVNNEKKFVHQTYGEWCFSKFLEEHFDDEDCSTFITDVVFKDESYKIIRSFMNFWINEKVDEETLEIYRGKILGNHRNSRSISMEDRSDFDDESDDYEDEDDYEEEEEEEDREIYTDGEVNEDYNEMETAFHAAGREGNENIFWFLYSSLTKSKNFDYKRLEVEQFLFKNYTAFANYLKYCDDNFEILSKVKNDFGIKFIKMIFTIKIENEDQLFPKICESDRNVIQVFDFLTQNFKNDLNFLRKVFLSNFLFHAFENLRNETILELLDKLELLNPIFGQDFVTELILLKPQEEDDIFLLSRYARSKHFNNEFFIEILNKLKSLCDEETMKKLLVHTNNYSDFWTFLHCFCHSNENFDLRKVVSWINQELEAGFLMELIFLNDTFKRSFFHVLSEHSKSGTQIITTMKFAKNSLNINSELLIEILLRESQIGEKVISNLFEKPQEIDFYKQFFKFLEEDLMAQDQLQQILTESHLILFCTAQNEKTHQDEILNLLREKFGQKFLENLYSIESLDEILQKYSIKNSVACHNYFKMVEEQNGLNFLKNHVFSKNPKGQTILFRPRGSYKTLIEIIDWIKLKFHDFQKELENFLLQVDENSNSFLTFLLQDLKDPGIQEAFGRIYIYLFSNFDENFLKKFLLLRNNNNQNVLNIIICEKVFQKPLQILDLLWNDLYKDVGFFKKLLNEELQKRQVIKTWMKYRRC